MTEGSALTTILCSKLNHLKSRRIFLVHTKAHDDMIRTYFFMPPCPDI